MSLENKGSMPVTVFVTREPDRSGNWICDGTADDVEIQAALDYIDNLGGGIVHLGIGSYDISSRIEIGSYTIFEGEGIRATILTSSIAEGAASYAVITNKGYPSTINYHIHCRQFTLDANQELYEGPGHRGIGFRPPIECTVEQCEVFDVAGWGISFYGGTTIPIYNNKALFNYIYNCGYDCIEFVGFDGYEHVGPVALGNVTSKADGGVSFYNVESGVIHGNEFFDMDGQWGGPWTATNHIAIPFQGITDDGTRYSIISNNVIYTVDPQAHYHAIAILHGSHHNTIVGNTAIMSSTTWYGRYLGLGSGNSCIGNVFLRNQTGSAQVFEAWHDNIIVANRFLGTVSSSTHIIEGDRNIVADNIFYETGRAFGSILVNGDDNLIRNNYFTDSDHTHSLIGLTIVGDRNVLGGNHFYQIDTAIQVNVAASDTIIGRNRYLTCTTRVSDASTTTIFEAFILPFVEGTDWQPTAPWGWQIDADTEYAATMGFLPGDVQEVRQIRVLAVALEADAEGMRLQLEAYGGASSEAYTTETIAVVDKSSETAAIAINDIVYWLFVPADDTDIDELTGLDAVLIKVLHEGAGGDDIATNAKFLCAVIEYI